MDPRFAFHNTHRGDPREFRTLDPQLRALRELPFVHQSPLLAALPTETEGVFTLTGGRQIGKTTLLKQWMAKLLDEGVGPDRIAFFTGELIDDHHSLVRVLTEQLNDGPIGQPRYLLLDEVTYIRDWDKGVKFLADAGLLRQVVLVLTGSDSVIIQEARTRFPGRRGRHGAPDFHLYPLNFLEVVRLKRSVVPQELAGLVDEKSDPDPRIVAAVFAEFEAYLEHGGFLTAINDLARADTILPATFATYLDWIRGDVLKRGKQDHYLREVLGAVLGRLGSQVTWNNLAQGLSIDHPATVADYMSLLAAMDVVYIQPALVEDKLSAAPKKARKLNFTDPFIAHAVRAWLSPVPDPFGEQVIPGRADPRWRAQLAESTAVAHLRRWFPTFYIKAEAEVDIAYVHRGRFWPVEVKWTQQVRPDELKQVVKYRNGRIWGRAPQRDVIRGVPAEPLPVALLRMCLAQEGTGMARDEIARRRRER